MKKYKPIHKRKRRGENYILNQRKRALLGIIDVLILHWIKEDPISGQDMMNRIQEQFNIKIGPGTMYPILFSLKNRNLVNTKIDKKRKLYILTNKGKIASKAFMKDYVNIQKDIGLFLEEKRETGIKKVFNILRKQI
ncbi:MAG: PadR family transcriptional regulator [Nanoarchaeota archaeon]|nr:PadR family transcriptional regulator [Nanoarchaeota archaeon]